MLTLKMDQTLAKRWRLSRPALLLLAVLLTFPLAGYWLKTSESQKKFHPYPFSSALNHTNQETLERSISFYKGRVQRHPDSGLDQAFLASAYLKMARVTGNDHWFLLAEQSAQQSLANLPFNNDGAIVTLAKIAVANHDFPAAIRLAEQASGEEALATIVTAKLAMGRVQEAHTGANTLVDLTPSLGSFTLRGLTWLAQGEQDRALQDFQQAIAAEDPAEKRGSAWTRTLLGDLYFKQGNHAQARELYQTALQIIPDYPLALLHLAELETQLGHFRLAERHYSQLNDPVALHGIARVKSLQGDDADNAWQVAEAALRHEIDHHTLGHRRDLAHLLLERGESNDIPEAISLMQAEATHRQDAETLTLLAWALSSRSRWTEAQQAIGKALDLGSQDAGMVYRAGLIEAALGNLGQAEQYFRLAQEINPTLDQQTFQRLGLATHQ